MWAGGEGGRLDRRGQMEWWQTEVGGWYLKRLEFSVHLAIGKRWHSHTIQDSWWRDQTEIRQTHQSPVLSVVFKLFFWWFWKTYQQSMCKAMTPSHADLYEIWPTALEAAGSDRDQRKTSVGQWGNGLPPPYHWVPFNKGTVCPYVVQSMLMHNLQLSLQWHV